jgi:N6-L-threonylcarbamoyladenine synthase
MSQLSNDYTILAIETSCDETAAALVRGGHEVLANVVTSQIDEHRRYGGVVPEVASRQHILALTPVIHEALQAVPEGWDAVHAIAVTYGPGLAGALMTGINAAKAIAWARGLPLIAVNHLEAHIYANWLTTQTQQPVFPLVALVVSGGHTLLALLEGHGQYRLLGQTRDDAAGEAFDKVARILGLGFPGGPAIQQAAEQAPGGLKLPRAWLRDSYDFSFSGLKTAVLHQVQERKLTTGSANIQRDRSIPQLAAAFQESVVDVLVSKSIEAARAFDATEILLAGGVAANTHLRAELTRRSPVPVRFPPINLCTDNAAMIAAAAFFRAQAGSQHGWELDVQPNLRLGII